VTGIYEKLQEITSRRIPAALCVIIDTQGSTPRKAGAKMIVFEDGKIFSTIGGGALELRVISEAKNIIKSGKPGYFQYNLGKDLQMSCNGNLSVYIEPVFSRLPLYLFGAGHVNQAVARYASDFGFEPVFIDSREGIDSQGFKLISAPYTEAIENLEFNASVFCMIATPDHASDELVLTLCAKKQFAFLGLIGSRSKVAGLRSKLLENKILSQEELDRVNMPVGIKFAAETAEEIAISILAKLIDVKNNLA
jgi:xanthine dehydrogenase accessory factor